MSDTPDPDPDSNQSSALEAIVFETLERMEREGSRAIESAVAAHPALETDLRRRLQALEAMGLVQADPAMSLAIPERLGSFEIVRPIGEGGMGVVLLGRDTVLDRPVALKVIRPELLNSSSLRKRFTRECQAVARLQDPGIARILDAGEADELPYMAMEYVPGCTLTQVLDELKGASPRGLRGHDFQDCVRALAPHTTEGPVQTALFEGSWSETCVRIVRAVAEGLAHAHGAGVLHRDIKSSNVMVTPNGRVLLIDFGLARLDDAADLTATGGRLGSLPYTAPEHVNGTAAPSASADVYGLGVILYELLSLQLPFRASSEAALTQRILEARPERLETVVPGLPRYFAEACRRAMRPDPERRPPTAADFAGDLSKALAGRPPQSYGDGVIASLRSRWRARPVATAAMLMSAALLLALPTAIVSIQALAAERTARSQASSITRLDLAMRAADRLQSALPATSDLTGTKIAELRTQVLERLVEIRAEMLRDERLDAGLASLRTYASLSQAEALVRLGRSNEARALLPMLASIADAPEAAPSRVRLEVLRANLPGTSADRMRRAATALRQAAKNGSLPDRNRALIESARLALASHHPASDPQGDLGDLDLHVADLSALRASSADAIDVSMGLVDLWLAQAQLAERQANSDRVRTLAREAMSVLDQLEAAMPGAKSIVQRRRSFEALLNTGVPEGGAR